MINKKIKDLKTEKQKTKTITEIGCLQLFLKMHTVGG